MTITRLGCRILRIGEMGNDISKLIKENEELKTLLGLSGISENHRKRLTLLPDIVAINSAVIALINKGELYGVDLHSMGVFTEPYTGFSVSTGNHPLMPIFNVNPITVKNLTEACSQDELYPVLLREHLKLI